MKIAVVSSHFPPIGGGVADYTASWTTAMINAGHEVNIITAASGPAPEGAGLIKYAYSWRPRFAGHLRTAALSMRPDVVVVQYVPQAYSTRGSGLLFAAQVRRAFRATHIPLIVNAHEVYGGWNESFKMLPTHILQRLAAIVLIGSSSRFVVTVRSRADKLAERLPFFKNKFKVIPVGPTVAPSQRNPGWRKDHGIPTESLLIASFGLGHRSQGAHVFPLLLDTLSELGVAARLVTAGHFAVGHRNALCLGYLSSEELGSMLASSDLFVLPYSEGVSGRRSSLISALGAGLPVVSTVGKDTDPGLFPNGSLCLAPTGDDKALIKLVCDLASDGSALANARGEANKLFVDKFSWEKLTEEWTSLINGVVHREGAH